MQIKIEEHTKIRAEERGASESEIREVLRSGTDVKARLGRFGKSKVFEFDKIRNNKYYKHKRIEVIYTIEDEQIVTITVYVFFGEWQTNEN